MSLVVVVLAPFIATPALTAEPSLTVPVSQLAAALHCQPEVATETSTPIMLVTGTAFTGEETFATGFGFQAVLLAAGHASCYVDFPDFTTADVQISVQYLVYGIREMARRAGRRIGVFGISQGGLLPRLALTYWPSLRQKVDDVVAVAGTQHGSTAEDLVGACDVGSGCAPAVWQQAFGSQLLNALNGQPDETPGPTSWTTVRSLSDEVVQPQDTLNPTSSLLGASNVLIQDICPGRITTHVGALVDSVSFAALLDAVSHAGGADPSRFPADVCAQPYAPGLDAASTKVLLDVALGVAANRLLNLVPKVEAEPALESYTRPQSDMRRRCERLPALRR